MSQNGKGSSPRNIFSANWRNGYDGIDWAETWYSLSSNGYDYLDESGTMVLPAGTAIKIRGSTVYTILDEKTIELKLSPSMVRGSGMFSKTKPDDGL